MVSMAEEVRNHIGAGYQVEFVALEARRQQVAISNPRLNLE
jgi:hypothetical protein